MQSIRYGLLESREMQDAENGVNLFEINRYEALQQIIFGKDLTGRLESEHLPLIFTSALKKYPPTRTYRGHVPEFRPLNANHAVHKPHGFDKLHAARESVKSIGLFGDR